MYLQIWEDGKFLSSIPDGPGINQCVKTWSKLVWVVFLQGQKLVSSYKVKESVFVSSIYTLNLIYIRSARMVSILNWCPSSWLIARQKGVGRWRLVLLAFSWSLFWICMFCARAPQKSKLVVWAGGWPGTSRARSGGAPDRPAGRLLTAVSQWLWYRAECGKIDWHIA